MSDVVNKGLIILNEQTLTPEEFEEKKKELETHKGVKVVEISAGVFKTRFQE